MKEYQKKNGTAPDQQSSVVRGWLHELNREENSVTIRNYQGIAVYFIEEKNAKAMKDFLKLGHEDALELVIQQKNESAHQFFCREIRVLNRASKIPFTSHNRQKASAALRSKYRYMEFRDPEILHIFQVRHKFILALSNFLDSMGFVSIETPLLTTPTLTGAKEFLVSSSKMEDLTYALPQSSQIYGQLIVAGGVERYYQFSRCFRDENLRANRQPEFTQLHIEMAFLDADLLIDIVEKAICCAAASIGIQLKAPFPQMNFFEAKEIFETDKPDLRRDSIPELLPFSVMDVPMGKNADKIIMMKLPDGVNLSALAWTNAISRAGKCNFRFLGFARRQHLLRRKSAPLLLNESELPDYFCLGVSPEGMDATLWIGNFDTVNKLRNIHYQLFEGQVVSGHEKAFVWIRDFPLFEKEVPKGPITSANHPFVSPADESQFMQATRHKDLTQLRSNSLDIVLNGEEIGSGSIVNHREDVQKKIFRILGIKDADIQRHFGFMMDSLKFGLPPIGGLGLGIDRILSIFLGFDSIRDVIAFPKTKQGYCAVTKTNRK